MVKQRKGLGKNQGKGFKNIIPGQDSRTHSQSAKGIKQPQFTSVDALVRRAEGAGKDIEKLGAKTKTEAFAKRTGETAKKALESARKQLRARQQRKAQEKIKMLEEIDHPITNKITKQQRRVAELKNQIALNKNEAREDRLFDELQQEERQLRELQEQATELQLQELSDNELKTLAVRYQPGAKGFLGDLIGFEANPYEKEIIRRINTKQKLERDIAQARKEGTGKQSDPVGDFFADFFK